MNINKENGYEKLLSAFEIAKDSGFQPKSKHKDNLKTVILASHKTYKYILLTALLSKAIDNNIDPIALQAGSSLKGSYDARSVCHSVLVPFERDYLNNALGGSNEPFLNKPARFKELRKDNAVRRGADQNILNILCDVLPKITTTKMAYEALCDCMYFILTYSKNLHRVAKVANTVNIDPLQFIEVCRRIINKSCEGESLPLVISSLLKALYSKKSETVVRLHPVNQSGASSKEVCDIDIFVNSRFYCGYEIKDKLFTKYDVQYALKKVKEANGNTLFFVLGPQAKLCDVEEDVLAEEVRKEGLNLIFANALSFIRIIVGLCVDFDDKQILSDIVESAFEYKFKQNTIQHICSIIK